MFNLELTQLNRDLLLTRANKDEVGNGTNNISSDR